MEIRSIESFLGYFDRIRERTLAVARCVPPEHFEWTYAEGKFTVGDLLRHIAASERYMFVENCRGRPSSYPGHGRELADGRDEVLEYMLRCHAESVELLRGLDEQALQDRCELPSGTAILVWKWLRAMIEHEVHHRGQVFIYLGHLGVPVPALYGLTEEEVRERSVDPAGNCQEEHPEGE